MITQVLCACDKKELTALEGRENLRIGYARTPGTCPPQADMRYRGAKRRCPHHSAESMVYRSIHMRNDQYALFYIILANAITCRSFMSDNSAFARYTFMNRQNKALLSIYSADEKGSRTSQ